MRNFDFQDQTAQRRPYRREVQATTDIENAHAAIAAGLRLLGKRIGEAEALAWLEAELARARGGRP